MDFTESLDKRLTYLKQLIISRANNCELFIELLNILYYVYQNSSGHLTNNVHVTNFFNLVSPLMKSIDQLQLQRADFDHIKMIGFGNFGQVSVVREKSNGSIYAMKTLYKIDLLQQIKVSSFKEERDVLILAKNSDWLTKLHYSFQDEYRLYLVMDFYTGGDLTTLLSKYNDLLPEHMVKFYCAQIIKAISFLHDLGYIHRDIKPANILLDSQGHARLADFGSCIKPESFEGQNFYSKTVGTPDYISPEVLRATDCDANSYHQYGKSVDWWGLGVLIYEALFGTTPFYSESLEETYNKILNFEVYFRIPDEPIVSENSKEFIARLICDTYKRFSNASELEVHSWFSDIDWDNLRNIEPPYKPSTTSFDDTSNFDIDLDRPVDDIEVKSKHSLYSQNHDQLFNLHLPFLGYSAFFSIEKNELTSTSIVAKKEEKNEYEHSSFEHDGGDGLQVNLKKLLTDLDVARKQWSDLSSKITDMRKEKVRLLSHLQAKEADLEYQIQKTSELRNKLARLEVINKQFGINDITRMEGYISVPKNGGVRKGWKRVYVVICDFKLFLYDLKDSERDENSCNDKRTATEVPNVFVNHIIDLREVDFNALSARNCDVIHAAKSDVPNIIKLCPSNQLLMVKDENDKLRWIESLNELHKIVTRNELHSCMECVRYSHSG